MTERAFSPRQEMDTGDFKESSIPDDFKETLVSKLNTAQDAREAWGRCEETAGQEKAAMRFAAESWPCGTKISIRITDEAQVFDSMQRMVEDPPAVFLATNFVGFDHKGARFLDIATSTSLRVPDIREASINAIGAHEYYSGYE